MEKQFRKTVRYLGENTGIQKMIRESPAEPGGLTYLILIYRTGKRYEKYVKTPFNYRKQSIRFNYNEDIIAFMRNITETVINSNTDSLPDLYMDWLRTEPAGNAEWAIHFWQRPDGDLEGRVYYVPQNRESLFYGTKNLLKILQSVKEDGDGDNKRASDIV